MPPLYAYFIYIIKILFNNSFDTVKLVIFCQIFLSLISTYLFFPDPKNIAVYKHSTDNWQIKINEDSWTLFENQIVPKEAKGQLISKCPFGVIISNQNTNKKKIKDFCPSFL